VKHTIHSHWRWTIVVAFVTSASLALTDGCTLPGNVGGDNVNQNSDNGSNVNMNDNQPECSVTAECGDNELCREAACVALPQLAIDMGYTDPQSGAYTSVEAGMTMPFNAGFQGLSELYVTIRVTGLSAIPDQPPTFEVTQSVTLADTGFAIHEFTQDAVTFSSRDADTAEIADRRMILDATFNSLNGRDVNVAISVALDIEGRTMTAALNRQVTLTPAG